ncbi:hypothetical protein ACFRI7_06590 [Streptomyces sp. NPDC056716]|uniref:hypothetical protein n=1 Tax=unclassified Streptomyces TaxID=2593676 RepID=UPI003685DA31
MYAAYAASGARHGVAFARRAATAGPREFGKLNDPVWLRARFTAVHGTKGIREGVVWTARRTNPRRFRWCSSSRTRSGSAATTSAPCWPWPGPSRARW